MRLEPYNLVSAEAAWAFRPATTVRLILENALDERYEEAVGFAAPRARARLMLTQTF